MNRLHFGFKRFLPLAILLPAPAYAQQATITDIGRIYAPIYSSSLFVSGNGTTLAGTDPSGIGFTWTAANGQVSISTPPGATTSTVSGISADGSVVIGDDNKGSGAFRWTAATGFTDLGKLNPASPYAATTANGISSDGSVVVGTSLSTVTAGSGAPNLATHPYMWTAATGIVDLTPGSNEDGVATAVSGNGRVVVGNLTPSGGDVALYTTSAFQWTAQTGLTILNGLPGAPTPYAVASAADTDGGVIVGTSATANDAEHAVRWNAGVAQDLGTLGGTTSQALAVNADGSVIVGTSQTTSGTNAAFRWTSAGMIDLNQALTRAGVNLTGITLQSATSVSADGQFIAATGTQNSQAEGFLVRYSPAAAGVAAPAGLAASVNLIGRAKSRLMAQQFGMEAILDGAYRPIAPGSEIGAYAAIGSASGGVSGRARFADGLSLQIGVADTAQRYDGIAQNGAVLTSLSLRYVFPGTVTVRPLIQVGGWFAPDLPLTLTRPYANGAGTALGQGTAQGGINYVYGSAGGTIAASTQDDVVLTGELGREELSTSAYAEAVTAQNPFNAVIAGADAIRLVGKLRAQWTHRFGTRLDATLFVAAARALTAGGVFNATVAGLGPVTGAMPGGVAWAELGTRVGWRFDIVTAELFAGGVSGGSNTVGSSLHGGAGVRVPF